MAEPQITIVDLRSGRGLGGHCHDYLIALQQALADLKPRTLAPFLGSKPAKNTRLNSYTKGVAAYRDALSIGGITVVHNPGTNDFLTMWIAAMTVRRGRSSVVTMLYRDPDLDSFGAGGRWLNRLLVALISRMIRRELVWPASDSAQVLANWLEQTHTSNGSVVSTPPLPTSDTTGGSALQLLPHQGPLFVIPGRMRLEKGAANYRAVVDAAIHVFPECGIAIQTSEADASSAAALAELKSAHGSDPRVQLLGGHLTGDGYASLLRAADVVVLPYDVELYGEGSSGVIGDALEAGTCVVAAPIAWIRQEYAQDPRIVFVENPASVDQLASALAEALERRRQTAPPTGQKSEHFTNSWKLALEEVAGASGV